MAVGNFVQNGCIFSLICMILSHGVSAQAGNANDYIDEAMVHWQSLIRESGYDPLIVKSFQRGRVSCSNCVIEGLSTIRRTGDVNLNATESFIVIDMNIGIDLLNAKCNCAARWLVFNAKGAILGNLANYKLSGHIEQYAGGRPLPQMTDLAIVDGGQLTTHFEGDGVFGTLVEWFGQDFIRNKIKDVTSNPSEIKRLLNQALASADLTKILNFN